MSALPAVLARALEVLEDVRGNINPERGYADEMEADVASVVAELRGISLHPQWIEVNLPFGPIYDADDYPDSGLDSITERGLNRAGVLLKFVGDPKPTLIGHVNTSNGGCGCCSGISHGDLVTHYAIVWEAA